MGVSNLIISAMLNSAVHQGVLVTVAAALLGMALGRLVSRAFDRPARFYPTWCYFWVEVIGAAALLLALRF